MSPIRILWESDRAEKQEFFWSHISIPLMAEIFTILPKRRVVEFISSKLKQYLHFGGNINHCTETFTKKNNSKQICSYFAMWWLSENRDRLTLNTSRDSDQETNWVTDINFSLSFQFAPHSHIALELKLNWTLDVQFRQHSGLIIHKFTICE